MTINEMKKRMSDIVTQVSAKYPGGENYFNELDSIIKTDTHFLISYINWIVERNSGPIIMTGELGELVYDLCQKEIVCLKYPLVVVNGGLRQSKEITELKAYPMFSQVYTATKFTMIDDSYYSGKTAHKIRALLQRYGDSIENIYVFYDGSKVSCGNVKSLYRYYNK